MPATKKQGSGGSALKRLRKSLTTAGVVGQESKASRSKKDRKRGIPTEVGRNSAADKLSVIRDEFNPFEIKTSRTKFDVINRKVKGTGGKPALNKQIGEENRKKTLLLEMKSKGHVGGILDKRFGENNPQLTPEERMLERFTKEKQKNAKSSMFNLEDDDDQMGLTHYGQSLAEMDDFDDTGLRLSDDEEGRGGQLDRNVVAQMHFGGFDDNKKAGENNGDGEGDRPKSRAEVMKEIIMKSKVYKQERQAAKEEDENLREGLDEEFKDIQALLDTQSSKRKPLVSQTALFSRSEAEKPEQKDDDDDEQNDEKEKNKYDDYDVMVQELTRDKRAMATDRTKTEEEIALEEKEKLEKAERARKRRMEGLDSESEDEGNKRGRGRKRQRKGANAPEGDDLDDDYLEDLEDEASKLGEGLTLEDIQNGALNADDYSEDDEAEEGSGIDEDEEEDEEGSDENEEEDYSDLEEDEVPEFGDDDDDMNDFESGGLVKKAAKAIKDKQTKAVQSDIKREIPYTFECPSTHEEFLEIMKGLNVDDAPTVVKRIRVLYHPKLGPDNKAKLSTFLGVLVDHLGYIASTVTPLPHKTLESLIAHTFGIAKQLPTTAADVFVAKLKELHGTMGQKMNQRQGSAFPDVEEITLLRCLGKVFPTSDLTHPVVTPATIYMSQALALCRVQSEIDLGRGLFLCLLFHEYQSFSKRFVPEVLNFLQRSLVLLSPKDLFNNDDLPGTFPIGDSSGVSLHIEDSVFEGAEEIPSLTLEQLGIENVEHDESHLLRLSLLQGALRLLTRYLQLYASTQALVEVFEPLHSIVTQMLTVSWHKDIESSLSILQDRLKRQMKFCKDKRTKTPLRMQSHRPIPIAQHLPKFEQGYSYDKHYDPDRERSEYNKLQAQIKKEKKGAMRELRKDNMFMAREKAKERKQKDAEYDKMIKGVMNILESDQAEKKRQEREKRR
ncbi:nucleolar protein 14 [Zychaea mexicana]|uniref:nucleolar protein 14 n=1 Tax=Zychaea mexicana TaxID=64656 RepID=UPI0022FDC13D|nr:nucleolar protein 14 [Zychaea mexicana]KAI9489884.1 nucleolar protein 14 [Zychaea mexicana]